MSMASVCAPDQSPKDGGPPREIVEQALRPKVMLHRLVAVGKTARRTADCLCRTVSLRPLITTSRCASEHS